MNKLTSINFRLWGKVLYSVLVTLFFTLLPSIIGLLIACFYPGTQVPKFLENCYLSGEFLLYSVALLSSSYLVLDILNKKNMLSTVVPIVIISVVYSIIILLKNESKKPDINALLISSGIAIGYSFVLCIYTQRIQSMKAPDIRLYRDEEQKNIENSLS